MTAEQKTLLRTRILQLLADAPMSGLPVQQLHMGCVYARFNLSPDQLDAELEVLRGKGLLRSVPEPMNDAIQLYHITDAGRAQLKPA